MRLIAEQQIIHRTEFSLRGSGLGGFGRQQRMRMRLLQREISEYETHLIRKTLHQEGRGGGRDLAAWTLKVSVLDYNHPRVF
jgi:hypothetical protein